MKKIIFFVLFLLGLNIIAQAQGYSFLGTYQSNGVPNYLDTRDTVPASLLNRVSASLPESYPVPTYNPQYITTGTQTDITLNDSADVWVTFVGEGAGYKNVLGFYTYNKSNPPTSIPADSNITIVLPNVSAQYSGGGLIVGDRVKIGRFPANTGIGWVLLANGYQNNSVTSGHWRVFSNPDFNPENDTTLRHHNVLLRDTSTNCVVLGFEDIRRDYGSCDNDFNDALFYVKSNPITAIDTANINITVPANGGVSSGNNGGLESHSGLSKLVGIRNVNRIKENHSVSDLYTSSNDFSNYVDIHANRALSKGTAAINLLDYAPKELIASTSSYISSPEDLVEITTAKQVWSVDYLNDDKTIAAVLGTLTEGQVYDHTKVICDRLKGAELRDISIRTINGFDFIQSCIVRASGKVEYAVSFSLIPQPTGEYHLESLWNLSDYSKADEILNVQVWSSAPAYTQEIIMELLSRLSNNTVVKQVDKPVLPSLYVSKANYVNGKIEMDLQKSAGINSVLCEGIVATSETGGELPLKEEIVLNGNKTEHIVLATGHLFDAGFSVKVDEIQTDFIYQADGQWGLDYVKNNVFIKNFSISRHSEDVAEGDYILERPVKLTAETDDYISIYRFFKPAANTMDIGQYNSIDIEYEGNDMKIMMMIEGKDWKEYPSVMVSAGDKHISLTEFGTYDATLAKGFVFTPVLEDGTVEIDIRKLALSTSVIDKRLAESNHLFVYPNPANDIIHIKEMKEGDAYEIVDMYGTTLIEGAYKSIGINIESLPIGIYFIKEKDSEYNLQSKFIVSE